MAKKTTKELKATKKKRLKKKKTAKKSTPKAPTPKKSTGKLSQVEQLRKLFGDKTKRMTLVQIAKALDTDPKNAAVSISIAKNPKRTKKPFVLERNGTTGTYKKVRG